MATIVPTVTADNPHTYRQQIERVASFARRLHIDLADGQLAPVKLLAPEQVWWPIGIKADVHLMFQQPATILKTILELKPHLVVLHAEADGDFFTMAEQIKRAGAKVGVALLKDTRAETILPALTHIDHVLIFSGNLGHFGGQADLALLQKVKLLQAHKASLEVGWDGGINAQNAKRLVHFGVKVLNTGGFIQRAADPKAAYQTLRTIVAS